MSFISLDNISFSYSDIESGQPYKNAVDGVSLNIEKGEFVALLGHNGCGKSTVAKHLNAMLLPDKGKVYVDGDDTSDENKTYDIREKVGLVLQNPDNQLVTSIVEEDVAFAPENLGIKPKEIRKRVDEALKAVDMYEHRRSAVHKLSGGQKQRVAIAGILAMEPKCIVLDEPTAMLDPKGREEVLDAVTKLRAEQGISIVLITHYMQEATLADRIIVMDSGKILTQGTPKEVFSETELLLSHSLSVPQSSELIYKLKKAGFELPDGIVSDDECVDELVKLIKGV